MNESGVDSFESERKRMVEEQLVSKDIVQQEVIEAFLTVPRHEFVPDQYKNKSYKNTPLPIGHSQTISQPYVVAFMLQMLNLERGHRVLEVGTGSGYQTAILCKMGCEVFTVELIEELSKKAEKLLHSLGYKDVRFRVGDGYYGFEEGSPYDRVVVSAASEGIPDNLVDQLKDQGGRMVIPVGKELQRLVLIEKSEDRVEKKMLSSVKFVPLIKKEDDLRN